MREWDGWIRIRYEYKILVQILLKSGILFASDIQARWISVEYWMGYTVRWTVNIIGGFGVGIIGGEIGLYRFG